MKATNEAKVTNEVKEQIIAARKAGKQYDEIAEEFDLSRSYVNNICLAAGLKSRKWERRIQSPAEQEMAMEELSRLLLHDKTDPVIMRIGHIVEEMLEAGDGGTFYADGSVGLRISSTEIEIVDIVRSGTIASLQLRLKK